MSYTRLKRNLIAGLTVMAGTQILLQRQRSAVDPQVREVSRPPVKSWMMNISSKRGGQELRMAAIKNANKSILVLTEDDPVFALSFLDQKQQDIRWIFSDRLLNRLHVRSEQTRPLQSKPQSSDVTAVDVPTGDAVDGNANLRRSSAFSSLEDPESIEDIANQLVNESSTARRPAEGAECSVQKVGEPVQVMVQTELTETNASQSRVVEPGWGQPKQVEVEKEGIEEKSWKATSKHPSASF